jgi:hypothetical protein
VSLPSCKTRLVAPPVLRYRADRHFCSRRRGRLVEQTSPNRRNSDNPNNTFHDISIRHLRHALLSCEQAVLRARSQVYGRTSLAKVNRYHGFALIVPWASYIFFGCPGQYEQSEQALVGVSRLKMSLFVSPSVQIRNHSNRTKGLPTDCRQGQPIGSEFHSAATKVRGCNQELLGTSPLFRH